MIRLDCPACKKDSYSAAVEPFRPCPYCGTVYSGKYGSEKRRELRTHKVVRFTFSQNGYSFEATTIDISKKGICLKIFGSIAIPSGDVIDLNINNLFAKAQTRWLNNNLNLSITTAGCRLLNGNPDI
jgi:hypothetical protein